MFSLQFGQHIDVAQPGPGSLCVWARFREDGKCLSYAEAPSLPGLSRGQWSTVTDTAQPRAQVGGLLFHFHVGLQILSDVPGILPLHAQYLHGSLRGFCKSELLIRVINFPCDSLGTLPFMQTSGGDS